MNILDKAFLWILYSSFTSTIIVLIVLLIKTIFKNQLSSRVRHALWFLVLIRLLLPFIPESNLSLFNFFPKKNIDTVVYNSFQSNNLTQEQMIGNDNEFNLHLKDREQDEIGTNIFLKENLAKANTQRLVSHGKSNLLQGVINICSYIWFIGLLSICLVIFLSTLRFKKKASFFNKVNDSEVIKILAVCKKKLNINKNIPIYSGSTFKTPFIYGLLRPTIYLPKHILNEVNGSQLLHICLHEIAHYKRKDLFCNLLGMIAIIIHWFNPLVWFAMKEMRADRELACDNYVLEILGENESIPYGITIIKLSQIVSNQHYNGMFCAHFYENKSQIERRITMIKMFKKGSYKVSTITVALFMILGTTVLTNATGLQVGNKEFVLDSPTKHFNSLDRAIDFVDFEFKVPENIPTGYKFWRVNLDEKNVMDINFEKYEGNETYNFSLLVSEKDLIKYLKEQSNTAYGEMKPDIKFDTKPMNISNVKGTTVIIEQNFNWTEDNLKKLEKVDTKSIKHVPISETVNKYFVWEDEGIWYSLHYYFKTTTLEGEYHVDRISTKDDLINIITSLKYSQDIQGADYAESVEKFIKEHLNIYDEKDLKEAEKIIGFVPKFPLTLPGGFVPISSNTYHSIYEGEENSSTSLTTIFNLEDRNSHIPIPTIEFTQTKNTFLYDNLIEKEYSKVDSKVIEGIDSKTIEGIKVFICEERFDDKLKEAIKNQYYVWKQEDIVYTAKFIGNIDNEHEIVKTLIKVN